MKQTAKTDTIIIIIVVERRAIDMRSKYIKPVIEILSFDEEEIITASGNYAADELTKRMREENTNEYNITVGSVGTITE